MARATARASYKKKNKKNYFEGICCRIKITYSIPLLIAGALSGKLVLTS